MNGDISIQTNAIGSLASYLTNLTSQINSINSTLTSLNSRAAKAYGFYNATSGSFTNTYNVKTSVVSSYGVVQNGITGIIIILNSYLGVQGVIIATPDELIYK